MERGGAAPQLRAAPRLGAATSPSKPSSSRWSARLRRAAAVPRPTSAPVALLWRCLLLCGAAPAPRADLPLALRRPRRPVADGSFGRAIHIKTSLVRLASSLSGSVSRCASLCKGYCCAFALVRLFIRSPALSLCRRWCSQRQKICAWVALRGALRNCSAT